MDEDEVRSSKFEIRGHRGASRSRGGTRARRPHHVCPSGVHPPRLVGVGIRTTAFLPPRHTAKTATRVRSSAESIETSPRSLQNTGRPTGETRACDVATAGVIAGKSGDYTSVDLSRVTNRKLVPGNGQTAMGAYMTWWASVQHCPSAAGRNLGRPHRPRSPAGRDKPARRVLPVPEAHGPPIALTATRRGGRPP